MASAPNAGPAKSRSCPICAKPTVDKFRPFCSRRCADIDLHRWLSGRYAVPAVEADDDQSDAGPVDDRPPESRG